MDHDDDRALADLHALAVALSRLHDAAAPVVARLGHGAAAPDEPNGHGLGKVLADLDGQAVVAEAAVRTRMRDVERDSEGVAG